LKRLPVDLLYPFFLQKIIEINDPSPDIHDRTGTESSFCHVLHIFFDILFHFTFSFREFPSN